MRILLLTLYYAPDVGANAEVVTALAEGLADLGHELIVVTALPHYEHNRIDHAYRGKLVQREDAGAIRVVRTYLYVPQDKTRLLGRLLNYVSFNLLSTLVGLFAGRFDVVLAPSPPLTIGLSAYAISRLRGVPYVYNVQDIYPDVAVRLGVLQNARLIRFFRWMERLVYRGAAAVTVLSEGARRNLLDKGVPGHKVHVIPNHVDTDFVRPLPKDNTFARRHGLHERFVVLYAGNVGLSQGLGSALEGARLLADLPDVTLLIVGNGAAKAGLEAQAGEMGLGNVVFLPFQPRGDLPEVYASADVCLVTLRRGLGAESVPSKAYTIMAAGRPMIASVDGEAETRRLIEASGCGLWVAPEDPAALAEAVRALHADAGARARYGANGRAYVTAHHTPEIVARQYDTLLRSIVD